jgi:hypothetical protein
MEVKTKNQVTFDLKELFPPSGKSSRINTPFVSRPTTPGTSLPPSPVGGRRVFQAETPLPVQSRASRWLVTTLIVNANLVQVCTRNQTAL